MSDTRLFNEILETSFDQWKEDLAEQIKENFDEEGTGSITVKNWYDPSWERNFNYSKGGHCLFDDYTLKDGQQPTKADWRAYKKNSNIEGNFNWISNFIQNYFRKKAAKDGELIKLLKPLFDAGWKIQAYDRDVSFSRKGSLSIKLKDIIDEIKEDLK